MIDKEKTNNLLNNLAVGKYSVRGYCYKLQDTSFIDSSETPSKNHLIISTSSTAQAIPSLENRYNNVNLKSIFDKYSQQYKPDGWSPGIVTGSIEINHFKALLVAIATRQSNLGYPAGTFNPRWLMEYGWNNDGSGRMDKYKCEYTNPTNSQMLACADTQVGDAAATLKTALEGKDTGSYKDCNALSTNNGVDPANDARLKCVLRVYMTGINGASSEQGAKAADEVINYMIAWEEYFRTGKAPPYLQ